MRGTTTCAWDSTIFPKFSSVVARSIPLTRWANRAATGIHLPKWHSATWPGRRRKANVHLSSARAVPSSMPRQCGKVGPARLDVCRKGVAGRGPAAQYRKKVELQSKGQELRGQGLLVGRHQQAARITDPACIGPRRWTRRPRAFWQK
jgi:hypothetical protein